MAAYIDELALETARTIAGLDRSAQAGGETQYLAKAQLIICGAFQKMQPPLSAPVEDGEIEGLIARLDDFNRVFFDQGNYDRCASCDEIEADIRSLSARLAEAEREIEAFQESEDQKTGWKWFDAFQELWGALLEAGEMPEVASDNPAASTLDWINALKSQRDAAIAERDRLAGLVRKHWKGNCFGGVDHADAREIRAALASRLKAEGGANG